MNEKEQLVLELIRKNPFVSQQEIADEMKLSRPAVANLISGLMKKGIITGRAYVIPEMQKIVCIGGANVDRKFHLKNDAQLGTSNPTTATVAIGGVARNIAENLGRLGHAVKLMTVAGQDADWELITTYSEPFMDLSSVQQLPGESTGSYSAVLDPHGELVIAMATMDVYTSLTPDYISLNERHIAQASMIVMDLNCTKATSEFVRRLAVRHGTPLTIVPVSSPKMANMPDTLEGVTWFICNEDEAEAYTGIPIDTINDWERAVLALLDAGAEHVVVTRGSEGVMAADRQTKQILHAKAIQEVQVEDVTGAGDAFISGLLHGVVSGWPNDKAVQAGRVNAAKTLESPSTVRPELTVSQLEHEMEEYK
ncbi:carbohydrate kinase [Sporosarcina sp. Te-1]|uniref:carbohydrate kinase n=1 Tax=Sporosarcina sp. Te-1 TaxID=2818390 RepID=UPI001A9F5532|nr:carbohydrate kinase [Sporosarcina sp. Te-1]QTD41763.1 winged helix-turn-helix transcriptional regulator [Sporosarcina sp. Te-1]